MTITWPPHINHGALCCRKVVFSIYLHVKSFPLYFYQSAELLWWHVVGSWIHVFLLFRVPYWNSEICYVSVCWALIAGLEVLWCEILLFTLWEHYSQTEPYLPILGALIKLMVEYHKCSPPHKQVTFIRLKQAFTKFVHLRVFAKSDLKHSRKPYRKKVRVLG